jgi:ornithine cyclodeaminase
VATRLLAREDASDLAILGSGTQAGTHLEAMRAVRDIRRVRVWSRTGERADRLAAEASERHHVEVQACRSAREAVEGADLICTVTSAREPVLLGDWVANGTHVNAIGFSGPTGRELDTGLVRRARVFVDSRESARSEPGDLLIPIREGAIDESHVLGEIGEVVLGKIEGRTSNEDVTLFESVGLAIEDLAATEHAWRRAAAEGAGRPVRLSGEGEGRG